jgi:hypothetical protein
MTSTIQLILVAAVLTVSITAYFRSRHYARKAEAARDEALLASFRAHDSAMEAETSADRASLDQ